MLARRSFIVVALTFVGAAFVALSALASDAASPGKWIVFSAHPPNAATAQLFRVETSGAGLHQITTGALPATAPAISRSSRLAFARLGAGIYSTDLNGKGLRRLTTNGRDGYPAWSPDGKRIAFLRLVGSEWRVVTMTASGSAERRLPQAPPAGRPTWAADGKSIFIPAAGDLVRVDATTGKVVKYYGLTLDIQTGQTAAVSPDGRRIVWVGPRVSTGPPDCGEGRCPQFGLYLANVPAPHRAGRIVNDTGAAGFSPDGKQIVYVSKGVLTVRTLAGGTAATIATGTNIATGDAPPAWQPR